MTGEPRGDRRTARLGGGDASGARPAAAIAAARYARPVEVVTIAVGRRARSADEGRSCGGRCRCTRPSTIIPGLLDLTHVQNTGAAFGLLNAATFPTSRRS